MFPGHASLIITNIGQLVTCRSEDSLPRAGKLQSELGLVKNATIAISGNLILAAGEEKVVFRSVQKDVKTEMLDADGRLATPGLIDSHTHLVFSGNRADEFHLRLQGKSYPEIAKAGGGIAASVRSVRGAAESDLAAQSCKKLDRMVAHGTTTVEIKSGYGLTLEDEIKILRVVRELRKTYPKASVVPTFLGAHAIPQEYKNNRKDYVKLLTEKMIPQIAKERLAEFCDVFCEKGYFTPAESAHILSTGKRFGLNPKIHANEFGHSGGALVAGKVGAVSADHLRYASKSEIDYMKTSGVIAVLLPGTSFFLGASKFAPAREMIKRGLPVALATDFNPGSSMTESLQIIMTLACVHLKMTAEEVLSACTINAACALKRGEEMGSIEAGKKADIVVWEVEDYKEIPYHYGVNLTKTVIKDGEVVYPKR